MLVFWFLHAVIFGVGLRVWYLFFVQNRFPVRGSVFIFFHVGVVLLVLRFWSLKRYVISLQSSMPQVVHAHFVLSDRIRQKFEASISFWEIGIS